MYSDYIQQIEKIILKGKGEKKPIDLHEIKEDATPTNQPRKKKKKSRIMVEALESASEELYNEYIISYAI